MDSNQNIQQLQSQAKSPDPLEREAARNKLKAMGAEDVLIEALFGYITLHPVSPEVEYQLLTQLSAQKVIPQLLHLYEDWRKSLLGTGLAFNWSTPTLLELAKTWGLDVSTLEGQYRCCLLPLLSVLGRSYISDPRVYALLIRELQHPNNWVRGSAAEWLSTSKKPEAIAYLKPLLADPEVGSCEIETGRSLTVGQIAQFAIEQIQREQPLWRNKALFFWICLGVLFWMFVITVHP